MLKKSYYIFSLLFLLQFPCIANDNSTTTKITVKKVATIFKIVATFCFYFLFFII